MRTEQQSCPLCKGCRLSSIILWSVWLVKRWWKILHTRYYGWNDTWTKRSPSMLIDCGKAELDLPVWGTKELGANYPNLNDCHSNQMEISRTFRILDIANWCPEQEDTHSKSADLSNVAHDIFSIIPHGVGVEASFLLSRDVIGWRQSKTTGETIRKKVIVRQFADANEGILSGGDPAVDTRNTENNSQMKNEAVQCILHTIANVHDFLDMWQGSQTYVLHRRNLMLKAGRWQPNHSVHTWKRSWKHPGRSFNMMAWLHVNCQKDHLCHQLCLQRTSLGDEPKY